MGLPAAYDVIVCGGGPAGLSAALWLGRYRRKTLVADAGEQRNRSAERFHGYLGNDGQAPDRFLELAGRDVARYGTVSSAEGRASAARRDVDAFVVTVDGREHTAAKVLLATGVEDVFPERRARARTRPRRRTGARRERAGEPWRNVLGGERFSGPPLSLRPPGRQHPRAGVTDARAVRRMAAAANATGPPPYRNLAIGWPART